MNSVAFPYGVKPFDVNMRTVTLTIIERFNHNGQPDPVRKLGYPNAFRNIIGQGSHRLSCCDEPIPVIQED